jgi:NADPH:quinone reductase-like Zn-dependent oxidoreductase|eukprot:COSAG06_NODE_76_length_25790_cov_35.826749_3_plen_407_part_00
MQLQTVPTLTTNPAGGGNGAAMALIAPDDAGSPNPGEDPQRLTTMKAAHVTDWCDVGTVADTISFGNVPAPPAPIKSEVVVGVKASAINVDDIACLQDTGGGGWCFHVATPEEAKPLVGGCEWAGVVLAVGPDCRRLNVGDRVCGVQDCAGMAGKKMRGSWAEQTVAPEDSICPIPDDVSFVAAAAVGMAAHVAFDMLKRATALPAKGGRCLVLGASGGLGTVLLQLLRRRDVYTAAVCSGANAETVQRLGAGEVVDYTSAPFAEQLAGAEKFDVVFDFVGGSDTQRSAVPLLRKGGQFVTAVGPWQNLGDRQLTCCEWTGWACGLTGKLLGSCCLPCRPYKYKMSMEPLPLSEENFNAVVVEAGARGEVALEVPFEEVAFRDALRRVASRRAGGKVLVNFESTQG